MDTIKFTKVERDELEVLQNELIQYANIQEFGYFHLGVEDFLNAVIAVDVAKKLAKALRPKIESNQELFTIKISASEAAIIYKSCFWLRAGRTVYQTLIANKYKDFINQELVSYPTQIAK
jgi:hypothetical protein